VSETEDRSEGPAPEIVERIISDIEEGIPLAETCRKLGLARSTVYYWADKYEDFAGRIARARIVGFDAIAEETLEIADDATNDWMERNVSEDAPTSYVANAEHIARSKLRIETRLKLLAKWDPRRYGDKLAHVGGGEGDEPIRHAATVQTFRLPDNGRS
jgi:transposase-like protein